MNLFEFVRYFQIQKFVCNIINIILISITQCQTNNNEKKRQQH